MVKKFKIPQLSLSTKVLIGLGLGIFTGIFFGEKIGFLQVPGDVFIQLLKMTVLPYISVSLILGLGRLSFERVVSLVKKAGAFLLLFWILAFGLVHAAPDVDVVRATPGQSIVLLGGLVPHRVIPLSDRGQRVISALCFRAMASAATPVW